MQEGSVESLRVSVIIPTLNDAGLIEEAVASARSFTSEQVLVVDAGSSDGTRMLAMRAGAKVLRVSGEGGKQMRAAVRAASGDVLLFARPGTSLPADALECVREALRDARLLAGVFRCKVVSQGVGGIALRGIFGALSILGMSAFGAPWFVWRTAAEGEAAFRCMKLFADRDLIARLRRRGKVKRLESVATLNDGHGLHRLIWTLLQVPYDMGLPQRFLRSLYRKPRSVAGEFPTTALDAAEESITRPVGAGTQ